MGLIEPFTKESDTLFWEVPSGPWGPWYLLPWFWALSLELLKDLGRCGFRDYTV